jgi:copper transport protein
VSQPPTSALRLRRAVAAFAAVPMLLWLGAGTASAHAILESVDPADGSTLASAPPVVRLVYSEPVTPSLASLALVDAAGRSVAGIAATADPADPAALDVSLPPLTSSAYRLTWRVIDQQDFHVTTGTVVFGVGAPAPVPVADLVASANLLEVGLRWLSLVFLALACGSLLLLALVGRLRARFDGAGALALRLVLVASAGSGGAIAANAALFLLQASGAGVAGIDPAALLASTFGTAWALEQAVLAVMFVALLRLVRRGPGGGSNKRLGLVGGMLTALAGVQALTGHVTTGPAQEAPIRWVALTIHLVAVLAWVGGLAALAIAVGPLLRGQRRDTGLARAVLGRFWLIAGPALGVIAVTGIYLGGQLVESADALLLTAYGQALIVKTALALIAVVLGALNAAGLHSGLANRLRRRAPWMMRLVPSPEHVRAVVTFEAATAVAVVLAAAFMSASPPARGPRFDQIPATVAQAPVAVRADDLLVTVAIRPDRPGPNFLDIGVLDSRRPAPAAISRVTVQLEPASGVGGATLEARATTPGHYEIDDLAISQSGAWSLAFRVDRPRMRTASVDVPWTVDPPLAAPHSIVVSDAPLAPLATPLALALAVVLGLLAAAGIARRRASRFGSASAAIVPSPPVSPARGES